MSVKSFLLDEVALIVDGQRITGFGEGDAIQIERDSDDWVDEVGADGEVIRGRTYDRRGKITIMVQYGAEANEQLATILSGDQRDGSGVVPVFVTDLSGTTEASSGSCWIMKPPKITMGQNASSHEWVLRAANLFMKHGTLPLDGAF